MKYTNVRLSDLNSFDECEEAISEIQNDYLNVVGGVDAWCSGWDTELLEGAKKKIEKIKARRDRLFPYEGED